MSPDQVDEIVRAGVATPTLSKPVGVAAMRNRDAAEAALVCGMEEEEEASPRPSASLTNRSEMFFRCESGGSMMCTSGCGHAGSWMLDTSAAGRTMMGMFCVMVVSREAETEAGKRGGASGGGAEGLFASS